MRRTLRIFISSPGDVQEERLRSHLVVQKLARDYGRFFKIEPYLWEYEPMLASGHFQDAIEPPSASDIVVLVVYSRLGTALPERTAAREYRGIDGRSPVTGTEWEFEEALEAHKNRGAPDLLAYRKQGDPQASLADAGKRAEQERQWDALEGFWRRHFEGGGVFLAGSSQFRTLEEFDAKLEADLVRIIEQKIAQGLRDHTVGGEEATWLHGSPFQGLAAYDFHDSPIFFGRDAQVRAASTRLQAAAGAGTAFLLVLGASGSGKSSLARAGVLPALFAAKAVPGVGVWRRVVLRPAEGGEDPVLSLAKALIGGDPGDGEGVPELLGAAMAAEDLAAHLQAAPDDPSFPFRQALGRIAHAARAKGLLPHEEARLVILVDQVEELFTRDIDPARRALFVRILAGLARSGVVWIVATVRNDLWHRAAEIPQLVELVEAGARLDLPAPDGAEIIEIVRRPAAAAGIVFEKDHETGVGLDAVVSRAASEEPGALPLLSVMLQSLYDRDIAEGGGRALTFAGYRALGELKGAIAQRADHALAELRVQDAAAADALPRVLRALVTASGDGTATSRPARLDAFPAGSPELRLVEALLAPHTRLLVASERKGVGEVRLAHEALLENWPVAREQIATDRRDLQTRARLEVLQRRWSEATSPAEKKKTLLTSLMLAEGTDLVRRWGISGSEGLGAYVGLSEAADRWRRKSFALAASFLILIFAGIAAVASLQWRRAEQQTVVARAAEDTEREARGAADAARNDAERERDRADSERARALAALREAKRNSARTLAVQADLATDRSEMHRAMALAVAAGEAERDVLDPGEQSTSRPALLKALANNREVLHIEKPKDGWPTMPHDFFGENGLVYADASSGLMLADLATGKVRRLARLPERLLPTRVRGLSSAGVVVATGVRTLLVIEAATGKVRAEISHSQSTHIAALDVDEESRTAVYATGTGFGFVELDAPVRPEMITVPSAQPGVLVGQVRFVPGTRKVLIGYGLAILEFDRDANSFAPEPFKAELVSDRMGRAVSEEVAAKGLFPMVEMVPDPARDRVLLFSALELMSMRREGGRYDYDRDTFDTVLGISSGGIAAGKRSPVVVIGRRSEAGIDVRIGYIYDEAKPFIYETFRASASDLGNEELKGCTVSRANTYLACHYSGKKNQGLFVWHVQGGAHRGSRVAYELSPHVSGVPLPAAEPRMLLGSALGLKLLPAGTAVTGVEWDKDWRLLLADGDHVIASSSALGKMQVLRATDGEPVRVVLPPTGGVPAALEGPAERALITGADRLTLVDLKTGKPVWAVPGMSGLRAANMSPDGSRAYALTAEFIYVLDGRTGRIVTSYPASIAPDTPAEIDAVSAVAAFVGSDGPALLDLSSGQVQALRPSKEAVAQLAFAPGSEAVVIGYENGSVAAVSRKGEFLWAIPSPVDESFAVNALPGKKERGAVLGLAVSRRGRLAIVRQDVARVDLHDLATGQLLTRLTSSGINNGVPATGAFDEADRLVTSWAAAAVAIASPNMITFHALPLDRANALAAAEAALAAFAPLQPDGSRGTGEAAN